MLLTGGHCAFTIRVYAKTYLPVALTEVSALRDVIQGQVGSLKRQWTEPAAQRRRLERPRGRPAARPNCAGLADEVEEDAGANGVSTRRNR